MNVPSLTLQRSRRSMLTSTLRSSVWQTRRRRSITVLLEGKRQRTKRAWGRRLQLRKPRATHVTWYATQDWRLRAFIVQHDRIFFPGGNTGIICICIKHEIAATCWGPSHEVNPAYRWKCILHVAIHNRGAQFLPTYATRNSPNFRRHLEGLRMDAHGADAHAD